MSTPDSFGLELREDPSLPAKTLVAPIGVIRDIRAALGELAMNIQIGWDSPAVMVSSDLYEAFNAWSSMQEDTEEVDSIDEGLYN
ncbi:MAG: hypothetical protein DWH81_03495 [Planctomycetota bacterium]|jgi:hypothetical protein|nr:MAG: hypothetical protein DWH81_03495 [Planctomycetota bacterium]